MKASKQYDRIEELDDVKTPDEQGMSDEMETLLPDQGANKTCTIKDCSVKCQNIDEENLSKEILSLPLEVMFANDKR